MRIVYPAIFTPCEKKSGYTVVVPDLPGCVTEGSSLADAIYMASDAACGWILGELEDGNSYPAPSDRKDVEVPEGSFVNLILVEIDFTKGAAYGQS